MRHLSVFRPVAVGGLALAVAVGALRPAEAHPADPCEGLVVWPLYVAGLPAEPLAAFLRENPQLAEDFLYTPAEERALRIPAGSLPVVDRRLPADDLVIGGLGIGREFTIDQLVQFLREVDVDLRAIRVDVPEPLRGLGGLSTVLFLQKVFPLNEEPVGDKILMGRIRDYTFVEATGRGHLSVDTCIDVLEFVPLGQDRREFIHWDIEIMEGGFAVMTRDDPDPADVNDPGAYGNPFPGIGEALPAFSTDPADPRSIWRRGLDHKLHASHSYLKIAHIHHRRLSDPDLVRLDDADPWYAVTDASCVDLFTVGWPPASFSELVSRGYCLGRCAHPPIVNSGE